MEDNKTQLEYLKKQVEMLSKTNFDKVKEMHKGFGVIDPETPDLRDPETRRLRANLIFEESKELLHELGFEIAILYDGQALNSTDRMSIGLFPVEVDFNLKKIAKESADLKVVTYGTDAALGIDADVAFDAVHQSNMSKIGADGKVIKREDGKVLKGPNYKEPNMNVIYPFEKVE